MLGASIGRNSIILGLFALATAALLAGTHALTKDQVARAERAAAERALLQIVPPSAHDNDLLTDTVAVPESDWDTLHLKNGGEIHRARQNGAVTAVIVPAVAPDGYSGDIKLQIGVNRDGTIAGVRVLAHSETPGLGDKIDLQKSDWVLDFNGLSLGDPPPEQWAVRKDGGVFDAFTGATITPRAVVKQVKGVLNYVRQHRTALFELDAENSGFEHPSEAKGNADDSPASAGEEA